MHPQTSFKSSRRIFLVAAAIGCGAMVAATTIAAVEAAVPLATLGFDPQPGKSYKLDLGVIFSDATGTTRSLRMYWANKATGLVM